MADLLGASRDMVKRPRGPISRQTHRFALFVDVHRIEMARFGVHLSVQDITALLDDLEGIPPRPVFSSAEARRLLSEGKKQAEIARTYGVPPQRVSAIARQMREAGEL